MSKDVIGALRVTLGFDTSQFEQGSRRAREVAKRDADAIKNDLSGVKNAIAGAVGVFLGAEAIQATKRALDYTAAIKTMATEAGVSRKELQEYRSVAKDVGLTHQEMDGALKTLTKTIGEAKAGTKEQATVFRDLNVAVHDLNGRVYSAGEVIPKLADALSRIKDPATRARLETKLFGEAGQKLDAMLTQGSKGIDLMRRRAHELGLVLDDELVDAADRAQAKLGELKDKLDTRFANLVARNADSIVSLANALEKLTEKGIALVGEYPRISSALLGLAVGARGGPIGMAVGTSAGVILGDIGAKAADDGNMDIRHRMQRLRQARAEMNARLDSSNSNTSIFGIRRLDPNVQSGATLESAIAEVRRQTALLQQATAAANGTNAPAGSVVPDGALPVPNERKRKGPKDRTEQLNERYQRELAALYDDQLGLQQDLTSDLRHQAQIEHERIDRAQDAYNADVDSRFRQKELTEAQATALKFQNDRNTELEHSQVNWKLDDELLAEETRVAQDSLDRERNMLQIRASLATTAAKRRETQLALLDNELESMRLSAEEVLARHDSTDREKEIARAKLGQLADLRSGGTLQINRETMGPLESYLDSIPDTADEINEAYENIAANGIQNMVDGLGNAAANTLKLKGLAGQLFNQLISDLIKFQAQQAVGGGSGGGLLGGIVKLGSSLLGGGSSLSGSIDTAYANVGSMAADVATRNASGAFSFAGGGDMTVLGRQGIDRNVLSLNGLPIANVSYGERLSIANDNGGGSYRSGIAQIVPSPYFDVVVDGRAAMVADPISRQNATGAVNASNRRRDRRAARRMGR